MANRPSEPAPPGPADLTDHIRARLRADIRQREVGETASMMEGLSLSDQPLRTRDLLAPVRGVGARRLGALTRELAILVRTGMPIMRALQTIGTRMRHQKTRHIIYEVGVQIENGKPFWGALATFPRTFSPLYVASVRSGEISGQLPATLLRLADHCEREALLRRKLLAAAVYPCIVLGLAMGICVLLSTFIAPVFAELLGDFQAELPLWTRIVMAIVAWVRTYWYLVLLIPIAVVVLYKVVSCLFPVRLVRDRLKLALPMLGRLNQRVLAARFARTFSILFDGGINIIESLAIARQAISNEAAKLDIDKLQTAVEGGMSIEDALKKTSVFPPLLVDMIVVGEQSGTLPEVLPQVAHLYEEEVNISLGNVSTIIEPFLILATGLLVAGVFYAFFVPYLKLISAIGGL